MSDAYKTGAYQPSGAGAPAVDEAAPALPKQVGRYRVERMLGQGGFGLVYLAHDDQLRRPVAIKVPHAWLVAQTTDAETYLTEARCVASLDHPHIVPVLDVGHTEQFPCFVVSKYIDGTDLAARLEQSRLSLSEAVELVATVAETIDHAQKQGLVHRDIKPGNILLDKSGKPFVGDFGLALREQDVGKGPRYAGTPGYMSPEQARGEGHRVDGRSDVFSLGVVLYELLTGRQPFRGDSHADILRQVIAAEPCPPRQLDDTIPRELERICLKAMSKRAPERYTTAGGMADDLRHFLQVGAMAGPSTTADVGPGPVATGEAAPIAPTPGRSGPGGLSVVKVVPKGLRSFDRNDADFFLELLPGARDRAGLPESLRFWKTRIESSDPDATFRVGLIYGPSGCGKSSLVKAGLLPRLGKDVLAVYIEATPEETEARLLRGLRKACPDLPADRGLVDTVAALRRGRALRDGRKVLLVLDQFEQWLFARRGAEETELVAALRHCDGEHVQAIVLVRDDFWLASSRFLRDLEIRLLEGENSALVDLFDPRHARKVLTAFGQAYGALPDRAADLTSEQHAFLDRAVAGLAQDGKIISVRLALFAEMVKGRQWTPATLREVGGMEGVGVTFLEETFSAATAPPEHRLHQKAAQAVLKALLPETGTDIKGQMRSEDDLRAASGYAGRPRVYDDLVHMLDAELRLITPTDPEGLSDESPTRPPAGRYYQLTHDYLVRSLRDWLTRKQRETRRGRAELRLAERAALWNPKPENRRLPSVFEWANIRLLTRKREWTEPQRRMMRRAARVHGLRGLGLAILIALATWGSIEGYGNLRASALVESLKTAHIKDVPALIEQLHSYRRWAGRPLAGLLASTKADSDPHLRASLASLALFPDDNSQAEYLSNRLLAASPLELPVIWGILRKHHPEIDQRLRSLLDDPNSDPEQRFNAACALANTGSAAGEKGWDSVSPFITDWFLTAVIKNPGDYATLIETLRPLRKWLLTPLASIFRDTRRSESERIFATTILADYASDDPDVLADLLMDAGPKAFASLFPVAKRQETGALPVLRAEIAKGLARENEEESDEVKDRRAERQARAAVALVRLGHAEEVWPLLRHSADPRLRSFITNWLSPLGADPKAIDAALLLPHPARRGEGGRRPGERSSESSPTQRMDAILFHPETSIRRALILALGTYGTEGLSPGQREPLIARLLDLYRDDPDAGIHGAAEWTLRQWKQQEKLKAAQVEFSQLKDPGERRWFVNSQRHTFTIIEGPVEFRMGSPPSEPDRFASETPHRQLIPHRFAIADKEVTVAQFQEFIKETPGVDHASNDRYSSDPNGPMNGVSWYDAAAYCNWLSRKEKLPECYEPNGQGQYAAGMRLKAEALKLTGYRLPTEAEWEYASRAGAMTSRHYGYSVELLGRYAWYVANSQDRAWPGGGRQPNDLGMFDMLGNVFEWCQDPFEKNRPRSETSSSVDIIEISIRRPLLGGAFSDPPAVLRSAYRFGSLPADRYTYRGFRPARTYH